MKLVDQMPEIDRVRRIARSAAEWAMCAIFAVGMTALIFAAIIATQGCSTRTLVVMPDGTVNASVTAVGYCPEATLIRAGSVEMISEASGVGAVVRDVVEVVK